MANLRIATPDDDIGIVGLLNASFRSQICIAEWDWFVRKNPLGTSHIYIAEDGDRRIVGCYGMFPAQVWISGTPYIVSYAHQLAIDPHSRGGNLFFKLSSFVMESETEFGRPFAITIANSRAYPLHRRLMDWTDFARIRVLSYLCPKAATHGCIEVKRLPEELRPFLERTPEYHRFCFSRSMEWLKWRFLERPAAPYHIYVCFDSNEVVGYIVLKRWEDPSGYRKVHIMDMQASDAGVCNELLAAAETFAEGADEVNIWSIDGYVYERQLSGRGFRSSAEHFVIAHSLASGVPSLTDGDASYTYADADGY